MRLLQKLDELKYEVMKLLFSSHRVSEWAHLIVFVGAIFLMLVFGGSMIDWLRNKRWRSERTGEETWTVREDTPHTHQKKQGTPSMGGLGIIGATLISYLGFFFALPSLPTNFTGATFYSSMFPLVFLLPFFVAAHAALGFGDDWSKASGRGGLRARAKLFWQVVLACSFVFALIVVSKDSVFWSGDYAVWIFGSLFLAFIIVATSNAVNLTDGIDGLAAGLAVQAGIAMFGAGFTLYALSGFSVIFWAALAGACFGFLFFNHYPARVFMGDTGSLAIGAALGAGAILQHAVFLLPFIGFIYFVEMFSVITQVLWFKWTKHQTGEGKRLFRRAPLHHHFELSGWSEWRVVGTFWAINLFTSAIGLWLWGARVLPRWP